jgi:hypothetical protein
MEDMERLHRLPVILLWAGHPYFDCPRGLAIAQDKTTTSGAIASHSKELLVLQETSKPWDSQHLKHIKPQWHSAGDATVSSCQIERVV